MSNIFSETEVLKLPRSFQQLTYNVNTSLDYGKLYPIFVQDCVPGDTIKISAIANIKAKPMVSPNLTPNKLTMHFFFVPYRLLDENFTKGIVGTTEQGEKFSYSFPTWKEDPASTKSKTLWDYFGLPINVSFGENNLLKEEVTNVKGVEPTAYLKRGYNKIYNDMYRPENFEEEIDLDSNKLQYRAWRPDYFTKALPFQQKPADELYSLPIQIDAQWNDIPAEFGMQIRHKGDGAVTTINNYSKSIGITSNDVLGNIASFYQNPDGDIGFIGKTNNDANLISFEQGYPNGNSGTSYANTDHYISSTLRVKGSDIKNNTFLNATTFDISDLRLATQLQKWAERNARGGTRYDEYIRAHFGVTPKDARLQLPEFLGGLKMPILVGENYQTSETNATPQGNRVGIGNAYGGDKIRTYFCEEYGLIMGIASILPQAKYQQGLNRQWLKHDILDWYHHEFCCLSEREIYQAELVCSNSTSDEIAEKYNKTIFGYTGIYNEYRFAPNIITGEMRLGQYATWNQSRIMDAGYTENDNGVIPNTKLSRNFVQARAVNKSVFASQNEDPFLATFAYKVKAFRPMTYKPEPGLIDHF